MPRDEQFDEILLQAIDEGLAVLGESVRHIIYYYVRARYDVDRIKIPKNPSSFASALRGIFGEGASVIETKVLECLYQRTGEDFTRCDDWEFTDHVLHCQRRVRGRG